jgi:hypothetical protein
MGRVCCKLYPPSSDTIHAAAGRVDFLNSHGASGCSWQRSGAPTARGVLESGKRQRWRSCSFGHPATDVRYVPADCRYVRALVSSEKKEFVFQLTVAGL